MTHDNDKHTHDGADNDAADNADKPDVIEQADETVQLENDPSVYGAYEAENFGPEGDASQN